MVKYIFKVHFLKTFNDGEVQVSQWHHQILVLVRDSEESVKSSVVRGFSFTHLISITASKISEVYFWLFLELAYFWKVNVVIGSSGYLNQRLAAKGESDWLLPYYSLFR